MLGSLTLTSGCCQVSCVVFQSHVEGFGANHGDTRQLTTEPSNFRIADHPGVIPEKSPVRLSRFWTCWQIEDHGSRT
jgi:hypothetical protein